MIEENKNKNQNNDQSLTEVKKDESKSEKEPGFFVKLFSKKPAEPKDAAKTSNDVTDTNQGSSHGRKGNIFTRMFGSKEQKNKSEQSIIENIVANTNKVKSKNEEKIKKQDDDNGEKLLKISNIILKISIILILISAGFFYSMNIDQKNYVLGIFDAENHATQLIKANKILDGKKQEEANLNKEIAKYKKGYINEFEKIIEKIITNRMDWSKLMKNVDEVTDSVYSKNALTKYVEYNNYSYDVKSGKLTISGTLTDPLGKNLTKLAELEEAFMYYPKTKNDTEDKKKPYFYNMQEFTTYSKTLDSTTDRYKSNFSIYLYTKESSGK